MSQVPEKFYCFKRNTYVYPLDLHSIILNEIWRCHVFVKPKQPKRRYIWFEMQYPSRLSTRINGHMEYLKSGKGNDWLKYQLLRSQVYLKPTTFIKLSRWIHLWSRWVCCPLIIGSPIRPGGCEAIQRTLPSENLIRHNCRHSSLFCSVGFGYSVIAFWD